VGVVPLVVVLPAAAVGAVRLVSFVSVLCAVLGVPVVGVRHHPVPPSAAAGGE